ncbi:uncharacterized protein CLUP02_09616 [Colletotrichum lupini]|uniref:Uncharacterized protein n=1 Tax=Colletotrichum lupini TaxID=145971 RepID=A0A9Q8SVB8_9PEZI|nr:uncharacterized protein CLUP02_09616 [Colletotrichum lupini]UQC84120.1 hypothetical protein CLUP02_09616 [Colletotrichum lupini]
MRENVEGIPSHLLWQKPPYEIPIVGRKEHMRKQTEEKTRYGMMSSTLGTFSKLSSVGIEKLHYPKRTNVCYLYCIITLLPLASSQTSDTLLSTKNSHLTLIFEKRMMPCRRQKEKRGTQLAIIDFEGSNNRRYWKVRTNVVKTYVGSSLDIAQPLIPDPQSSHPLDTYVVVFISATNKRAFFIESYVMEMFAKLRAWACQENEVLTKDIDKEGWLSEQAKASCHTQTHQSSYKHSSLVIGQEDLITVSCLRIGGICRSMFTWK